MATHAELKSRYRTLHRYMCGIAVTCLLVAVAGGTVYGDSDWLTTWKTCASVSYTKLVPGVNSPLSFCYDVSVVTLIAASTVVIIAAIAAIEYVILKIWAAWEDVHHGSSVKITTKKKN